VSAGIRDDMMLRGFQRDVLMGFDLWIGCLSVSRIVFTVEVDGDVLHAVTRIVSVCLA
jgi:hypothetical protein